jgi:uncharacterized damage-inducible protein DinB
MYEYNQWANHLILTTCEKISAEQYVAKTSHSFGSLRGTLVHTLDAEWSWRRLLTTEVVSSEELTEADIPTLEALRQRWDEEERAWRDYLHSLTDVDMTRIIRYTLPESGVVRERVLWHCLYHVVNHGMQHRSEAAAMLTDYGQSPGGLDFTLFLNQRAGLA